MRAVMVPSARASAPKSPPAASGAPGARRGRAARSGPAPSPPERSASGSWTTPRSRPSHVQRTSGAATWLNPAASRAISMSTSGRGASESQGNTTRSPRSPQSSTVVSSSSRTTATGPGAAPPGARWPATAGPTARRAAHPCTPPDRTRRRAGRARLLARTQEVRFLADAALARRRSGRAAPCPSPTRSTRSGRPGRHHFGPPHVISVGASGAHRRTQPQPRLGQRAQRPVALVAHSTTGLSSANQVEPQEPVGRQRDGVRLLGDDREGHATEHLVGRGTGPLGQRQLGRLGEPAEIVHAQHRLVPVHHHVAGRSRSPPGRCGSARPNGPSHRALGCRATTEGPVCAPAGDRTSATSPDRT